MSGSSGSLGFASDLGLLVADGSVIEERIGHRVVRTAANPLFRWGNFLLLDEEPGATDIPRWTRTFGETFPGAPYVALGVDRPHPAVDADAWRAAGFTVESAPVLTAPAPLAPGRDPDLEVRSLDSDADWAGATALDIGLWSPEERDYEPFARVKWHGRRALAASGRGVWFGAFDGQRVVASLGIVLTGAGTARYQQVETNPDFRRRGLASALLRLASAWAAGRAADRLVIVADPTGPAADLYRSLGFVELERQVRLERLH